ncbi:hypothetical protein GR160_12160 [Flavobacterium sp. Sd200]|uniref:VanZ family protein n=1 Tax=Flavobacterium sp. Sd200 TaxID=2692211 RepID=UPI00137067CC|nr:VanZ family protein [Flavobacterium sp. Sd200]MXN91979.1 hypothetical protein [Flavobacterium sp. Sd200]
MKERVIQYVLKFCSIVYFALLSYVTFFARRRNGLSDYRARVNLRFMQNFRPYADLDMNARYNVLSDILGNVIIFLPLAGAIYYLISKKISNKQLFLIILLTTLTIESAQYIFNVGVFDVNDVVFNFFGGVVGMYIHKNLHRIFSK